MSAPAAVNSTSSAFFGGLKSALLSVYVLVLTGTYIGLGALAHGAGVSPFWLALSTIIVWAAPAQLILITGLGSGGTVIDLAIAVSLSATRLFPMVVALLPLLRGPTTRLRNLLLPTHFTAISMWVESLRLLPSVPREHRIAFCNGLSAGYMGTAAISGFIGHYLAAGLPPLLAGVLLFLTPMSFFLSIVNNAREWLDKLALVLGLVLGPLLVYWHVQLDLMWTGLIGGSVAYAVHRFRESLQ
jgi:predicted branched-subunit amino acid permease